MFNVIILLRVLVISFCVFFSLLAFSPLSPCPFPLSCFVSLSLLPLLALFLCLLLLFPLVISWPFVRLLCSLFFLRFFFSSLFSSSSSSFHSHFGFFSLLWPLFLSFLFPFSSSCLSFSSSFVLSPLLSSSFVSVSFPLPSSSFSSVLCLFGGFLFFLFAFLAFGLHCLSVCVFGLFWSSLCFSCWCFRSRGSPFVPVSLSSLLISRRLLLVPLLLLLSSSRLFLLFPLLCLFFLLFFYLVPSCRLCCCASLSDSFFLGFALLRSFLCPRPFSLRLGIFFFFFWLGSAPAQRQS